MAQHELPMHEGIRPLSSATIHQHCSKAANLVLERASLQMNAVWASTDNLDVPRMGSKVAGASQEFKMNHPCALQCCRSIANIELM